MPLRQIEIIISKEDQDACEKLISEDSVLHYWQDNSEEYGCQLKFIVDAVNTEKILDKVEHLFGSRGDFRLVMTTVDATLPRIGKVEEEDDEKEKKVPDEPWEKPLQGVRVSREELYAEISDAIGLTRIYIALVISSTIVAALGILRDNTAVVIGAMVIAPLLGPNVGLALSTALGDFKLGMQSIKTNLAGLSIALVISVFLGVFMQVNPEVYNIASRTEVHLSDISLALASGVAGVLAYTVGMSTAVIGVMVAVALLPPLVTSGLLLGDLQWGLAYYSILLLLTNIICVNLAGVATFILQGVRPRTWYETKKASKSNKVAISIWIALLITLGVIIYYA